MWKVQRKRLLKHGMMLQEKILERKLSERLKGTRARVGEEMSVNDVYNVFKGIVMEVAN